MHIHTHRVRRNRGFTLIEILVVIGMLAILSTVVLVAVNPLRQFAQARNTQRQNDVAAVLNAISERIADKGGMFLGSTTDPNDPCRQSLPGNATNIALNAANIRSCLVPTYISELPRDPANGVNTCKTTDCNVGNETYDLQYTVAQDSNTNRITVCAPNAAESALPGSTSFCLTP